MRRSKTLTAATILTLALGLMSTPYSAAAQARPSARSLTMAVAGTGEGTFTGTFQLQRFVTQDGAVFASGVLSLDESSSVELTSACIAPLCSVSLSSHSANFLVAGSL